MTFNQAQENFSVNRGLQALPTNEITKLKLDGNIILNDFIFNTIDDLGVVWVVTDIAGWWETPEAIIEDIQRAAGDGGYDVEGRYSSRNLRLQGVFLTPDPGLVESARDRLVKACDLVKNGAWLKTGTSPVRASYVYMVGQVITTTENARGRTNFSIELRASDPIKYDWDNSVPDGYTSAETPVKNPALGYSGSLSLTNIGNYKVPCIFEIVGPFEGPGTIFNRTTGQLILLTQGLRGRLARSIVNKELNFDLENLVDIATLTTTQKHGFSTGDSIYISGVGEGFDGDQVIKSIPTDTTFTYETLAAKIVPVTFKQISPNPNTLQGQYIATLETVEPHTFVVGDEIIVDGVDFAFDGRYTITETPTANKLIYSRNRTVNKSISSSVLVANIATLSTVSPHEFIVGETVTVSGLGVNFDGAFEIVALPDANSFSYAKTRTNSRSITNKVMVNDVVTLTTAETHGFIANEAVNVTNVNLSLNGGYVMSSVTDNTFSYRRPRLTEKTVTTTAAFGGVVTLTTSTDHGYVVGEAVDLAEIPEPTNDPALSLFAGTKEITTLPSNTTFTYAQPVQFTVTNRARTTTTVDSVSTTTVTLTGTSAYPFEVGDSVSVQGVASGFNGEFTLSAVTPTSISYVTPSAANVNSTASSGSVYINLVSTNVTTGRAKISKRKSATVERIGGKLVITTDSSHGAIFGESITVTGAGTDFNGTYTISGIPLLNVIEADTTGDNIALDDAKAVSKARRNGSGVSRITTVEDHGYAVTSTSGHKITVSGIGQDFDGTFDITAVGAKYIEYSQPGEPTVSEFDTNGFITKDYGHVTFSGTITSSAVSPAGQAKVAGTLPFRAASGTATVSPTITRRQSGGNAIKENNVIFTPGLSGATGIIDADILEIDTKKREVAFNGEVEGARGRIDVLADFIELAPGQNEIEFEDVGNPEGSALLKIFYRSGWLA